MKHLEKACVLETQPTESILMSLAFEAALGCVLGASVATRAATGPMVGNRSLLGAPLSDTHFVGRESLFFSTLLFNTRLDVEKGVEVFSPCDLGLFPII